MCHEPDDIDYDEYILMKGICKWGENSKIEFLQFSYGICDYISSFPWISKKYKKENSNWIIEKAELIKIIRKEKADNFVG